MVDVLGGLLLCFIGLGYAFVGFFYAQPFRFNKYPYFCSRQLNY